MRQTTGQRVLVVSPVRLLRDGLATLLERRPEISAIACASNRDEALASALRFTPTVILLDVAAPDGVRIARDLVRDVGGASILAFAAGEHDQDVVAYAEAGIAGFVTRDASMDELFEAIERAGRGELLCSPRAAALMFQHLGRLAGSRPADAAHPTLTERECEIMRSLNDGRSNKEIARDLHISISTVKNHVHRILAKLSVRRRSEAVAHVRRHAR